MRVRSAAREAQFPFCSVALRRPPCFLGGENLSDVPPPRSSTQGPVKSHAGAIQAIVLPRQGGLIATDNGFVVGWRAVCAEATHEHSSADELAAVALLARMQRLLATTCADTTPPPALPLVAANSHASAGGASFARIGRLARRLERRVALTGPAARDAWLIGLIAAVVYLIVDLTGAGSAFLRFVADHPEDDLDDILLGGLVVGVGALAFSVRRWRELGQEVATRTLAEERLDRAQELAGIGSWEYDVAANRYIWSRNMYRLRGLTPDEFDPTSSAVAAYVHPEDEPRIRQYRDDLRAGMPRDPIEGRFIHPNGDVRILRIDGRSITDGNGVVRRMIGTAHDITEQQSVQRQLAQAQKMEMIGHLAGGMAHDFNNVLGIVIANLELLQDHMIDTASAVASAEELRVDALSAALHGAELTHRLLAAVMMVLRDSGLRQRRTH